jgi:hypothetical protein
MGLMQLLLSEVKDVNVVVEVVYYEGPVLTAQWKCCHRGQEQAIRITIDHGNLIAFRVPVRLVIREG